MRRLPKLVQWLLWIGGILLVIFTLMRVGLFFFSHSSYSITETGDAFFLGLRYDLRMIAILLLFMLLVGSFPFFHPFTSNRGRIFWMVLLSVATTFALFFFAVDFAHYAYLEQRLNASVLNYLEDARISTTMVWQSYPVIRIILGLIVLVVIISWLIRRSYRSVSRRSSTTSKRTRVVSFIVCFLVTGFLIFGKFNQYPLRWSDAFAFGSDYKANLALNPFQSFFSTLKFRHSTFDQQKVKELIPVLAPYYGFKNTNPDVLDLRRPVVAGDTAAKIKPNVVLVICESFSAYKSSMWGNPLNTTPFFDSLCRSGLFFDHCFTPSYGTARGVWASITGITDVEMPKTASRNPLAVDQHTIINDFNGYDKFYFLGGSTSWANIRGLLINNIQGLKLYEQDNFDAPKIDVWGISDKNLFLGANKVLAKQDKPFFAVIQTADNHRPYTIPEEDRQEFVKMNMPSASLKQYGFESADEVNAFHYTDFCFRKFIEAAKKEPYFSNTIFVFVGDHGIPGEVGNMFPRSWTEQRLAAMHVPLLFYSPGLIQPQRVTRIASQVDVLPTVAGLSKISYVNTTLGRNLLDSGATGFAFIFDPDLGMTGVVKGDYLFRKQIHSGKEELVSIRNNDKPAKDSTTIAITAGMRSLTNALYETSKYLLLNNKKNSQ